MNGELPDLFTQPRRIGILRTSPFGHSRKLRQEFIRNCLPLANKAGMTETARGAIQHGRASSTCAIHPPRSIAWGCEPMYGEVRSKVGEVRSKVCASVCASEKGKPVVRRGRKALGPPTRR